VEAVNQRLPVRTLWAALGVVLLGANLAQAQAQPAQELLIVDSDASAYPAVTVEVAVPTELAGDGLPASAFRLTEGGVGRPLQVTPVTEQIDVVLVVDTSGSMTGEPLAAAVAAAGRLVQQLPASARVAVIGVSATPYLVSELTADRDATLQGLASLQAGGRTAMWDAMVQAAGLLDGSADGRYVVLLSDGDENTSAADGAGAVDALDRVGAELYVVALESAFSDFPPLEQAVRDLDGVYLPAPDASALDGLYQEIAQRLVSRYSLSFQAVGFGPQEIVITATSNGQVAEARQVIEFAPRSAAPPPTTAPSPPPSYESVLREGLGGQPTGWAAERWALWLGGGAFFGALAILGVLIARPVLRVRLTPARAHVSRGGIGDLGGRLADVAEGAMVGSERARRLDRTLDSAGIALRPGELVVAVLAAAFVAGLAGLALGGALLGLVFVALAPLVAWTFVSRRLRKRREAFAEQIGDTLMILSGALRAGRGLTQAIDLVADEAPEPTCTEFQRVLIEIRIGRDLTVALADVADRMQSEDFRWFTEAVAVNRDLGGDLAEVLDNIGGVVRARNQIARQVQALSAEGRMSGWVLLALPVLLFGYMMLVNPDYAGELFRGIGLMLLVGGVVLMSVGALWIRKLVDLEY
jgi:tight adherence protein B